MPRKKRQTKEASENLEENDLEENDLKENEEFETENIIMENVDLENLEDQEYFEDLEVNGGINIDIDIELDAVDDLIIAPTKKVSHRVDKPAKDINRKIIGNSVQDNLLVAQGNAIFEELIAKQLTTVPLEMKLSVSDMKRICKYIKTSIFGTDCCFWYGYVTNANTNKGIYVNFYFKSKKVALHRLLYSNFVAPLTENEYLKINCPNRNGSGVCCNVNHYEKYRYVHTNAKTKTKPLNVKAKIVQAKPLKVVEFEATEVEIDFD
jgi:hypothetical protein